VFLDDFDTAREEEMENLTRSGRKHNAVVNAAQAFERRDAEMDMPHAIRDIYLNGKFILMSDTMWRPFQKPEKRTFSQWLQQSAGVFAGVLQIDWRGF
jgi:hypothetical protein